MRTMGYDQCARTIYQYLSKEDNAVRILNLMQPDETKRFKQQFGTSATVSWDISDFCVKSDMPEMDKFWNDLANAPTEPPILIYGFTSLLKLQGNEAIERFLNEYLSLSRYGKTILITYQCKYWLELIKTPKLERLIYSTNGNIMPYPTITFRSNELSKKSGTGEINGLKQLARHMEESSSEYFVVITDRRSSDFPNSLFLLNDENSIYDAVVNVDSVLKSIPESDGNDEFWKRLLNDLEKNGKSFQNLVDKTIGTTGNLTLSMDHWNTFDNYQRWILFLALKIYGVNNNWGLKAAIEKSNSPEKLPREIYRSILALNPADKDYWNQYDVRRKLLSNFDAENHDAQDFVMLVRSNGKEGLCYLSDSSIFEKEMIFESLDRYGEEYELVELKEILEHIYPELLAYLDDYPLHNELFDSYFRKYKYQKVINKLLPEFETVVEEQAISHDFIMLPTRAEIIDQQDYEKSEVYFMDAMGTEFLGFISAKCHELNLQMQVQLCKVELPSDTTHNKGFVTDMRNNGLIVHENDDLDHLKHGKNKTYDYATSKLPIHLIEEFRILSTVLRQVSKKLSGNEIKKIYLIPDHGSSRMAMIKTNPDTIPMETTGEHGGRNCAWHNGMPKMEKAIIENDYYSMANYDRFKGGHITGVELHGGATLEEVVIPFITIQLQNITYEIDLKTPIVLVSFKKKGELRFSSNVHLDNVQVRFQDELLSAISDGTNLFVVAFNKKPRPGNYTFDVLSDGNVIAENIAFKVQSEMGKEKELF